MMIKIGREILEGIGRRASTYHLPLEEMYMYGPRNSFLGYGFH